MKNVLALLATISGIILVGLFIPAPPKNLQPAEPLPDTTYDPTENPFQD